MNNKLDKKSITENVISAAIEVHNHLRSGFSEVYYHRALEIELGIRNIVFESEKIVNVYFKNHLIGKRRIDLLIDNTIVLEVKAVSGLDNSHLCQSINYLECSNLQSGLLINFGGSRLQVRRIYNNKFNSGENI